MNQFHFPSIIIAIGGVVLMTIGGYQSIVYSSYLQECSTSRLPCPNYGEVLDNAHYLLGVGITTLVLGYVAIVLTASRQEPPTSKTVIAPET